jgi:hypothetical protein
MMTDKTIFAAVITLLLAPTALLAEGGSGCHKGTLDEASLSCAQGTTWDAATKTCVTTTS